MTTRTHTCPAPDCERKIPAARFACPVHWRSLPYMVKARIYATYRAGQENQPGLVSAEYLDAAKDAIAHLTKAAGQ